MSKQLTDEQQEFWEDLSGAVIPTLEDFHANTSIVSSLSPHEFVEFSKRRLVNPIERHLQQLNTMLDDNGYEHTTEPSYHSNAWKKSVPLSDEDVAKFKTYPKWVFEEEDDTMISPHELDETILIQAYCLAGKPNIAMGELSHAPLFEKIHTCIGAFPILNKEMTEGVLPIEICGISSVDVYVPLQGKDDLMNRVFHIQQCLDALQRNKQREQFIPVDPRAIIDAVPAYVS